MTAVNLHFGAELGYIENGIEGISCCSQRSQVKKRFQEMKKDQTSKGDYNQIQSGEGEAWPRSKAITSKATWERFTKGTNCPPPELILREGIAPPRTFNYLKD